MRNFIAGLLFVGGLFLGAWLGGYVMLYKGITSAIEHITAGAVIKALFFQAGLIPGYLLCVFAYNLYQDPRE